MTTIATSTPLIELRGVGKRYGSNQVLRGIDLAIASGEAIGLVGENGAGKSTTVGILSGKIAPTDGEVVIAGEPVDFRSPREARRAGIVLIPQELAYLPDLTVAENIMLANWPDGRTFSSPRWMERTASRILKELEIDIPVDALLSELTLAERQLVEIAKALAGEARVLILDEPTASLHAAETRMLLRRLHDLKARGVALIYVSHHLDETFDIADRIVVLRNGAMEDDSPAADTDLNRTVELMLGPAYEQLSATDRAAGPTEHVLMVQALRFETTPRVESLDLEVRSGEVLGVFGLVGSGAETVARGLGGHERHVLGRIRMDGREVRIPRSPLAAADLGIAYVPAERKTEGLALNQSILENITLMLAKAYTAAGVFLRTKARKKLAGELAGEFDVRMSSLDQEVGALSGGNQQKVLLASRIASRPRVLVLHEPTRGVDIGARAQIHAMLADFARSGAAVVIVTSDLQEAVDATDSLVVLRDGRRVGALTGSEKTTSTALALAAGGDIDHH